MHQIFKTLSSLFLFILPLSLLAQWTTFHSVDGRFSIPTPQSLEHRESELETPMGAIRYHTFFYQPTSDPNGNQFFSVSYCDYPEGALHSDSTEILEEFFAETLKESAFSVNGELRYSEAIVFNGYPGRFWRVDYLNGQAVIKSRAFVVAERFYVIQVVTLREKSANSDLSKFLEGFKLLTL